MVDLAGTVRASHEGPYLKIETWGTRNSKSLDFGQDDTAIICAPLDGNLRRGCGGWEEFGEGDAGDDEGGSCEGAWAEVLMQEDHCGEPREDGFE